MLELVEGNLLEAQADALVNAVNTEGVMGKGIALQFAKKYPEMLVSYKKACKSGEVRPGSMHIFDRGENLQPRYIINFPTKQHWRSPSRIEDVEAGLIALVGDIKRLNIPSIALPALGCGNGGLDWDEVFPLIKSAIAPLEGVRVLLYGPKQTQTA